MGVRGAGREQLQRSASLLKNHGKRLVSLGVSLLVSLVLLPVLVPLLAVSSASGWVAVQQLPTLRDCVAGAVFLGGYIGDARAEIEAERESVAAERAAFREFADEVQSLSAPTQPRPGMGTARVTEAGTHNQRLRDVRRSYRETVMAVPNYESEYGESLAEHLAAEFSDDLARAVVEGHQFTQPVKQLLVQQARAAARRREPLLDALTAEAESLADAESRLRETGPVVERTDPAALSDRPFTELVAADADIRRARRQCERLLADRQHDIHRQTRQFDGPAGTLLPEYFYRDLDVTFPVLRATLDRLRALRQRRSALIRELVGRD